MVLQRKIVEKVEHQDATIVTLDYPEINTVRQKYKTAVCHEEVIFTKAKYKEVIKMDT